MEWNVEGLRLFQQRDKHTDCSRNLRDAPVIRGGLMKARAWRWAGEQAWPASWRAQVSCSSSTLYLAENQGLWESSHSPLGRPAGCSITCHVLTTTPNVHMPSNARWLRLLSLPMHKQLQGYPTSKTRSAVLFNCWCWLWSPKHKNKNSIHQLGTRWF